MILENTRLLEKAKKLDLLGETLFNSYHSNK